MAKSKGLSAADLQLWALFSQTISVLPGRARLTPVLPPPPPLDVTAAGPAPVPANSNIRAARPPVSIGAAPAGLDKATWKKFTSGKMAPVLRLDLHGHTAASAHRAVSHFIERAASARLRCVEIITGNGAVLARELPHWLNAPVLRPLILAVSHPHAANTGAVVILLRRARP